MDFRVYLADIADLICDTEAKIEPTWTQHSPDQYRTSRSKCVGAYEVKVLEGMSQYRTSRSKCIGPQGKASTFDIRVAWSVRQGEVLIVRVLVAPSASQYRTWRSVFVGSTSDTYADRHSICATSVPDTSQQTEILIRNVSTGHAVGGA
eukprot:3150910-Rhodomonas_salina.3